MFVCACVLMMSVFISSRSEFPMILVANKADLESERMVRIIVGVAYLG